MYTKFYFQFIPSFTIIQFWDYFFKKINVNIKFLYFPHFFSSRFNSKKIRELLATWLTEIYLFSPFLFTVYPRFIRFFPRHGQHCANRKYYTGRLIQCKKNCTPSLNVATEMFFARLSYFSCFCPNHPAPSTSLFLPYL